MYVNRFSNFKVGDNHCPLSSSQNWQGCFILSQIFVGVPMCHIYLQILSLWWLVNETVGNSGCVVEILHHVFL